MKTLIVCASTHHGNTQKIANIMRNVLDAKLVKPNQIKSIILEKYDLIGFGSGIYFWKHHKDIFQLVDECSMTTKNAFIFSTRGGTPRWINHRAIKKRLLKKGFKIIGEFSCRGFDTVGPLKYMGGINRNRPNKNDFEKAKKFALQLLDQT
jgi:flavodoxin